MKIIPLTSAATYVDGVATSLERDVEIDLPTKKAQALIKGGIAKAAPKDEPEPKPAEKPAPASTKAAAPAETK